jgi:hypothetical protein
MIDQVRICEACGSENEAFAVICGCGQPISHILPTAKAKASHQSPGIDVSQSSPSITLGEKICAKCGARHASHRLSCDCGERLPPATEQPNSPSAVVASGNDFPCTMLERTSSGELFLCFANQTISLQNGDVLGRQGTVAASSFAVIKEVSREHARILLLEEGWHIVGLSANITEVDGQVLERGKPHPLKGSHRVRLSSKCEIRLETT